MSRGFRSPAAVAADIEGRLVVSDAGNHRILVGHAVGSTLDVRWVVGSGEVGLEDGSFEEARFDGPRGVALSGDMLIVADRGNHAVRMVDLATGDVATMVGTGERVAGEVSGGEPLETALDFPWDVLLNEYDLYITMGGSGEVWRVDLKEGVLVPYLESAASGADQGPRPVTLATDGTWLYVADAAAPAVRRARFDEAGDVEALCEGALARCSGIAWGQGNHRLWVSDTGTATLRTIDPDAGAVQAVEPFEAELDDPTGLASAGHLVYLADTGHDRVLRVDQVDKRVVELEIEERGSERFTRRREAE